MPIDELSAYYAEILAVEEAHFEALYAAGDYSGLRNEPAWARDLDSLRRSQEDLRDAPPWAGNPEFVRENRRRIEIILDVGSDLDSLRVIQERHGIRPEDPRVFSIASFREEWARIQQAREATIWERRKLYRADPNTECFTSKESDRNLYLDSSCRARHFPGYSGQTPELIGSSRPKAWRYIGDTLRHLTDLRLTTLGREMIEKATRKRTEEIYSLLLSLGVSWAIEPTNYPRDFTEQKYRDHLQALANRLEEEEAKSLPTELCRAFAPGSPACARVIEERERTRTRGESNQPPSMEPTEPTEIPKLVTLDQIAALAHRNKRTLERCKTEGKLPPPTVEGGGGRADYWDWAVIRPWLIKEYKLELPTAFPTLRRN